MSVEIKKTETEYHETGVGQSNRTDVEIKKTETEYHETGVGQSNRTDVTYVLGATIDGVFVPFASVSQAKVDALKAAQDAAKAEAKASKSNGA